MDLLVNLYSRNMDTLRVRAAAVDAIIRVALPPEQQASVIVAIRTDPPEDELVRYTAEHEIDLAIVHAGDEPARALIDRGRASVLLLR